MACRRFLSVVFVLLGASGSLAHACPFCSMQGETLTGLVNQSNMVLYGTLKNPRPGPGGGSTDLVINKVIKDHSIRGNRKVITLPRHVPLDNSNKDRFLIFCDVYKGKVDPYRGIAIKPESNIDRYLVGALAVKDKPIPDRLRFFFDYLEDEDPDIANDALKEFGNVLDYKVLREVYQTLPADKIARWLENPNALRIGLYASMLGHCGKDEHAQLLRSMLDDPKKREMSGMDGVLAGYILLKPKEGWEYLQKIVKDPSEPFVLRYAALRACRFFHDHRADLISHQQLTEAVSHLIDQEDMADLAIEDLRRWNRGELARRVVGLYDKPTHEAPIIRRSILRYALTFPTEPDAAKLIQRLRQADPEMVQETEELLKLESLPPGKVTQVK